MLIVYAVDAPHGNEAAGLSPKAQSGDGVASSPASGPGSQATAISTTTSKM